MDDVASLDQGPPLEAINPVFRVYETRNDNNRLIYYGEPRVDQQELLRSVWPEFKDYGYDVRFTRQHGEFLLVAEPTSTGFDGIPWKNIILAVTTLLSTIYAGSHWYYVENPLQNPLTAVTEAWPFAVAVLGVLAIHELGHYVMSRYHNVDASLPYFIPVPTLIGTMGAVINVRGQIPNRKALFDIGVAGPLAGIFATIIVAIIGLLLPPITVPGWVLSDPNAFEVRFGYPPLLRLIAMGMDQPITYADPTKAANPVLFGAWVGMFITFLNLIPVGQLDGGHILRSMLGEYHQPIARVIPLLLFGLGGYLYFIEDVGGPAGIWFFWGLLALLFMRLGAVTPIQDTEPLDQKRILIGIGTLILGVLCFTPVPIQIIG